MSKSAKKRARGLKAAATPTTRRPSKPTIAPKATKAGPKQSRLLAMLQSPAGTTIAAMMKATGWQQHSVRGFLAGVVRKRLKLNLTSTKVDGVRTYRAAREDASKRARKAAR